MATGNLSSKVIEEAINRSLTCLRMNFKTTEHGGGWYHYLDDGRPGVTASAVGLYCFHLAGVRFEHTPEVVRYLLSEQVNSEGDAHGGWAIRTTSGVPIVEATTWVLRALSAVGARDIGCFDAVADGAAWLERNQNTDFGWGSYKGQPSRVFTTALAILALSECGGSPEVIANAQKWLIGTRNHHEPIWGPLADAKPSVLHTSVVIMARATVHGSPSEPDLERSVNWLIEHLEPGRLVEKSTTVEEYDVPYLHGGMSETFQNSLPHFATPMALVALLMAGVDPFHENIFQAVQAILDAQEREENICGGTWELPRSPGRPSIWAIWPFVAALAGVQRAVFPCASHRHVVQANATLLFPGCAILQTDASKRKLTRRLLVQNTFLDWIRRQKLAISMWAVAAAGAAVLAGLWAAGQLMYQTFLLTMVIPVLLAVFQILLHKREERHRGTG